MAEHEEAILSVHLTYLLGDLNPIAIGTTNVEGMQWIPHLRPGATVVRHVQYSTQYSIFNLLSPDLLSLQVSSQPVLCFLPDELILNHLGSLIYTIQGWRCPFHGISYPGCSSLSQTPDVVDCCFVLGRTFCSSFFCS